MKQDGAGRPPLVSIVLPTFDSRNFLEIGMASILRQTYPNWELWLVDDGSTDDTAEYVRSLPDPRIHYLRITHTGSPARARNVGIEQAGGKYVAFLDSDDFWHEQKLAIQVEALERRPDFRWSYTGTAQVDASGTLISPASFRKLVPHSGRIFTRLLTHRSGIACPSVLVERNLLAETGAFDETLRYAQDYDLWLRLAERFPVLCIDQPLVYVRRHTGSHTWGRMDVNTSFVRVYEKVLSRHRSPWIRFRARQQCAYYLNFNANQMWLGSNSYSAREPLVRAIRYAPWYYPAWKTAAKIVASALTRHGSR